jgi:hypothetical protein
MLARIASTPSTIVVPSPLPSTLMLKTRRQLPPGPSAPTAAPPMPVLQLPPNAHGGTVEFV